MEEASHHTYQVLTKRSTRMRNYINKRYTGTTAPSHIWLGASVEDGKRKSRIKHVQDMSASVHVFRLQPNHHYFYRQPIIWITYVFSLDNLINLARKLPYNQ